MTKICYIFKLCSQFISFICCCNSDTRFKNYENGRDTNHDAVQDVNDIDTYTDIDGHDMDDQVANNYALNTIICYSKFSNDIHDCTNKIYNSSDCMRYSCDYFTYSFKYICAILFHQRMEPIQNSWVCISTVQFYKKYEYDCNYHIIDELQIGNTHYNIRKAFVHYSKELYDKLSTNKRQIVSNPWYSMKYTEKDKEDYFILSSINRPISVESSNCKFEKSGIRFLLIEYTHPLLEQRLQIEIDTSWYVVGNELFSFAMIMHLLEHQCEKYIFDKNYTIYIMDNHIKTYELKYNEYILLHKHNFQVFTLLNE